MTADRTPVVFVHGLWLHADSWGEWLDLFRSAGYEAIALGWPGDSGSVEEARKHPERVAGIGIEDVVDHYAKVITDLPAPPVLIGHSFGGLIVQRLLGEGTGAAAVAIDPAPIKGVWRLPFSAIRVASVALRSPGNTNRAVSLSIDQFRYGFGNALPPHEAAVLYDRWTIPSPGKPLFEAALANFSRQSPAEVNTKNPTRGPLLLIAGGMDHAAPPAITRSTLKQYHGTEAITDYREFPDRGHSLALDHGWRGVADATLKWLEGHNIV